MKIDNFDTFKDDIFENLRRMDIDDVNVVCKIIYKLVIKVEKCEIEKVLIDKLSVLLEDKTNDVVEVVCCYLNISRDYCIDFRNGTNMSETDNNSSNVNSSQGWLKKATNLQWSDIARCAQSDSKRKLNIPCGDLMESGMCLRADTCCFTHEHCAVVKPSVSKFTSTYKTSKKVDYRSCILPGQNGYYDRMTVLPGAHADDAISISSAENSHNIDLTEHNPTIYEPPTMLDSPLWYQEMGLVEEDVDVGTDTNRQRRFHRRRSLIVSGIPKDLNRIETLNQHFRNFGVLRNIQVHFRNDESRALVEFRLAKDMAAAATSSVAVFGNRFIKTRAYKSDKRKDRGRRDNHHRRSSSTRKNHRRLKSHSVIDCNSSSRSRSCESIGCRDYGVEVSRSRRKGIVKRKRSCDRSPSVEYCKRSRSASRKLSSESRGDPEDVIVCVEPSEDMSISRVCKDELEVEEVIEERLSTCRRELEASNEGNDSSHDVNVANEVDTPRDQCAENEMHVANEVEESQQKEASQEERMEVVEVAPVSRRTVIPPWTVTTEVSDCKLEQALNDSDVESVHSDNGVSRTRRRVVLDYRRKQLQSDKMKNSVRTKLARNIHSLSYYKSVLESLIIEYRRNDKPGKAILIPKIKETHAKYMELKNAHTAISESSAAEQLRQNDPVEGQISNLGSSIEERLMVTTERERQPRNVYIQVPHNIILEQGQFQARLGTRMKVENIDKVPLSSSDHSCYVVTLQSPSMASAALQFLSSNNPMNWHMGLEPPPPPPQDSS